VAGPHTFGADSAEIGSAGEIASRNAQLTQAAEPVGVETERQAYTGYDSRPWSVICTCACPEPSGADSKSEGVKCHGMSDLPSRLRA